MGKNIAAAGAGDSLPEDIEFEILARLQARSLCRFRCVCSRWLSIISHPQFIDAHYAHSSANPKLLITVSTYHPHSEEKVHVFTADYPKLRQHISARTSGGFSNVSWDADRVSQSYGGLIARGERSQERITIFNPSTRECLAGSLSPPMSMVAFGFDPVDRKHKVLCSPPGFSSESRIYTLGDSAYRKISHSSLCPKLERSFQSLCINGVIYYIAVSNDGTLWLMAFDVRSESIRMLRFPELDFRTNNETSLIEYRGKVAIIDYFFPRDRGSKHWIIPWVLEDAHKQVWSRMRFPFFLNIESGVLPPSFVGTARGCELLFGLPVVSTDMYSLLIYNLEDYSKRTVEVRGLIDHLPARRGYEIRICNHVESLTRTGQTTFTPPVRSCCPPSPDGQ